VPTSLLEHPGAAPTTPVELAIADDHLFWALATREGGPHPDNQVDVIAALLDGGPAEMLAPSELFAGGMAADAMTGYWLASPHGTDLVVRAAHADGAPRTLASLGPAQSADTVSAKNVATDGASVFALTSDGFSGYLFRIPIEGGAAEPMTNTTARTVDQLTALPSRLTWLEVWPDSASVVTLDLSTLAQDTLVSLTGGWFVQLTTSEAGAFWALGDGSTTTFGRVGFDGTEPETLATIDETTSSIAADASRLYYAVPDKGVVRAIDLVTREQLVLATGQPFPYYVALSDTAVYWTSSTQIMKVAK
jgi:hypothetical protein